MEDIAKGCLIFIVIIDLILTIILGAPALLIGLGVFIVILIIILIINKLTE